MNRLIAIIIIIGTIQGVAMLNSIYNSRAKYFKFVIENKIAALQKFGDLDQAIADDNFLINESHEGNLSTGELFAIDSSGLLTVSVNNLEKGEYLPYASIMTSNRGFTMHKGRLIGWQKHSNYTIVYRKYIGEVISDEWLQFLILIIAKSFIIWIVITSFRSQRDNSSFNNSNSAYEEVLLLKSIVNNGSRVFIMGDENGHIHRVYGKELYNLLGRSAIDLVGQPMEVFLPKEKQEQYKKYYADHVGGRQPRKSLTIELLHENGHTVKVRLSLSDSNMIGGRAYPIAIIQPLENEFI